MGVRVDQGSCRLHDLTLPDRYEVLRHVANGGMASVWCAQDLLLGRRVAIKLLSEQFARDEEAVKRFKREARAAARLSGHPHVVAIYDVGETEPGDDSWLQRPFIVMEYLAGGTVADALRVGAVARSEAIRWLRQAASALDHAHERGVVHRDIKPGNLLLDCDRTLHVGDFGIARLVPEDTITGVGQLLGTAAYVSPEQALGGPATDASDRYALAVAAFELLVGERPFLAEHFAAQARQHIEEEPPRASERNRSLPSAADAVLARGMGKRPEDRWPTAGSFADALARALARTTVSAPPRALAAAARPTSHATRAQTAPLNPRPQTAARFARPSRPRRGLALAALAAAVCGIGVVIGTLGNGGTAHVRLAARARPLPPHRAPPGRPSHARPRQAPAPPPAATAQAPPSASNADTLEAQGHQLMTSGQYSAAIPVLRQALATAGSGSLTYAYALYDLGRSLRLGGNPQAAVPILQQRLQIPDQTDVVRQELSLAQQAAGGARPAQGAAGIAPQASAHHGRADHNGQGQGD